MAHRCLPTLAIITLLVVSQGASAKRGCSAFGHSCFGGHGKRSDASSFDGSNSDLLGVRKQFGQEETPPHPGYPHSEMNAVLPSGDNIIPIRDGGIYERDDSGSMREVMKMRLRNIVKHWMDNYRRNQQANDDAYFVDNL